MAVTRRNLLFSVGSAAAGLAMRTSEVDEPSATPRATKGPLPGKMKVIVCGGHPGDAEYVAAEPLRA